VAWTSPDKGTADNDIQSIIFKEYLEVLVAGINGIDCVLSGCVITGGADMTPAVAKGAVLSNGTLFPVSAGDVTIGAADATNPRIDLIVVNSAGGRTVRAGTAAAAPKPPARSANDVVLGAVYVPANATAIATSQITDMRVLREQGPIVLKKTTTPVTFNNTAAIQTYFTITLPSGLFLTGKQLRVTCGGTWLSNSGTPTWTLTIAYGGTTIYSDVSVVTAADVDRKAWYLDFILSAQANNNQRLAGTNNSGVSGTTTAPAAGVGDISGTVGLVNAIAGSSAVDSDAADRTLTVQWTMNVANAAVETVMEFGVAALF
jgi:hypothetical protein